MTEMFGPYEALERVAEGSSSTVYRARHVSLDRPAAIKVLSAAISGAPEMRARLRAEAEILAGLESPHVVGVYDFVEEDGRAWIAEEWVEGASLERILDVHGALSPEQSVGVVRGAVLGLAHAHDHGLLHRDVSPRNILADMAGTSKLVDFGLAAPVGEAGFFGTPAFMSPEATVGASLTKPSDVYSTAAVLYTLLAGHPPFAGSDLATTMRRQAEEEAPVLDRHGHDLQDLLRRSLAKDPAERPQDARAFLGELEEAARRRFGATWLQRASIAGLVAASVPVVAAGVAGGSAAAPTILVDTATIASAGAARLAKPSLRKLTVLAASAAVVVAGTLVTVSALGNDGKPGAGTPQGGSSASPVAVVDDPEPAPPTPEELTPSGKYRFTRTLISSTYDQKLPKKDGSVWTLDLKNCKKSACKGTIASSSGKTFKYTWNGKKFTVIPPKGGVSSFEGLCVVPETGVKVPGSLGRVTETVRWLSLTVTSEDADGLPGSLEGAQHIMTTYKGLTDCDDSPTDRARYRTEMTRR